MNCVVFDIDGTLANGDHRLFHLKMTPKDWEGYFAHMDLDTVIEPIADLCRLLRTRFNIVYCTGRPEQYAHLTSQWLQDNKLPSGPIYYRKKGDFRDDSILKVEQMKEITKDGNNILMVLDDRSRVVSALRAAGYTVLQVAAGDY